MTRNDELTKLTILTLPNDILAVKLDPPNLP